MSKSLLLWLQQRRQQDPAVRVPINLWVRMVMPLRNINFQRLFKKLTPLVLISDTNTTPSFFGKQSVTAKERLSSTLKKLHADKDFKRIYWEQCLEKYPNLKELFLNGIGNVSIPISQKVSLAFII